MKRELKTYEFKCDWCKTAVVSHQRPADWITHTVHDCGMTGYSRDEDLCAACAAKVPSDT